MMPGYLPLEHRLQDFIAEMVAKGHYASEEQVVSEALRLLRKQEQKKQTLMDSLEKAFETGTQSGAGSAAETVFDRLEKKYRAMIG